MNKELSVEHPRHIPSILNNNRNKSGPRDVGDEVGEKVLVDDGDDDGMVLIFGALEEEDKEETLFPCKNLCFLFLAR